MKNKNILEVCFSPDLGGLELYMSRCSKELSKVFNVSCAVSNNSRLKDYIKDLKKYELKRKSSFSLFTSLRLAKIIDKDNIDIMHIHWTKDIPIVVFAKLFSKRKPKIVQTRHMTMTRFKDDFYHKFLYKNIDTIICVTKALTEQIKKYIPSNISPKVETLYLGAKDVEFFSEVEIKKFKDEIGVNDSFMVGLVGRINQFKGQYLLIEAMKILKEKNLNIKASIVGHPMDKSYLETLKQKVKDYGIEESLSFLGFIDNPNKFMQACDTLLMTSKNETFGLVVIEAMKNKTAVIGANSGGVLEIIDDNISGLLFESGNHMDLAFKIEKLYNNKEQINLLASNGKKKADEVFDDKKQFEKLIELFKKIGE